MSQEAPFDPRSQITHSIDAGQIYEDQRTGDELVLVFVSEDAALLKDSVDGGHRLETRKQFDENVGGGRYQLQQTDDTYAESQALTVLQDLFDRYDDESGRKASHKAEALSEAMEIIENNGQADDYDVLPFDEIDGIGAKAAQSLSAAGVTTKGDVRNMDRDEIEGLDYMGSKNTDALFDYVNQ